MCSVELFLRSVLNKQESYPVLILWPKLYYSSAC